MSVLIVDDDPSGRELSACALKSLGCELIEAAGGKAALELARSRKPSLLLLDARMPAMDGFPVLRALRADPETRNMCVVAFTASAMYGDRQAALDAGFSGFIAKPIGIAALRGQVLLYLNGGCAKS